MKKDILQNFKNSIPVKRLGKELAANDAAGNRVYISPLVSSCKSLLTRLIHENEKNIILLYPTVKEVNETKVELSILGMDKDVIEIEDFATEVIQHKITELNDRESKVLVTTYRALTLKLPAREDLAQNTVEIEVGSDITYDELLEYMNLFNYNRDKYVESPGDFAVRGSIIDFWSYSENQPARVEYDGDFLESIRYFDPESQRSSSRVGAVTLASEMDKDEEGLHATLFDYIDNPLIIASLLEVENLFTDKKKKETAGELPDDLEQELKDELYDGGKAEVQKEDNDLSVSPSAFKNVDELFRQKAHWLLEDEFDKSGKRINLNIISPPGVNSNFEILFNLVADYTNKGYEVIISAENEMQERRLTDLLSDFREELKDLLKIGKLRVVTLAVKEGFLSKDDKVVVLSDYQVFNKPYRSKISSRQKRKSHVKDFASIKRGDYVVHENFGIGRYEGLEEIKIGMVEQESIKIAYAEGGVVYVNLNYLSLVKKFASKENATPKLSVLGSNEWKNTKKKVKSKIKDAARELITLYAKRKAAPGYSFSPDTIWQKELEASFLYEDTPDQAKVSEDVKYDMENENPMDRLVCGDVGFGKTEIAVRAAFKAVNDGKQVGLLVPTTILAEQHFFTFKDRLSQFPVKIAALSRFQTKKEQTVVTENLKNGQVDIVIGTHRLLSKDVKFRDLGLLIIDEEQRFGVMAKEKLKSLKASVDTLTLTATPIPRTLNLSLLGARDLSIIATPPPNRQPIFTRVDVFNIQKVREWILSELRRNGQVYFVHDRVHSIDKIASYIKRHIPEIKIGVAHGQMKPSDLEKVIHEFMHKKFHMLISTKIIESGIDIPNVNTIIINRADRFGLAELHQLRGRVGRSNRQAYAYFLVPSLNTISQKAVRRLKAIEEYTELGEGFNLSMRDLEIRGAGNLLGTEQSGAIDTVGFDLYVKLLDEAVDELKKSEFSDVFRDLPKHEERSEPTVDTYFEIGIPQEYMPDQSDRLSFYTAMFSLLKVDELKGITEEMEDRFGKLPVMVQRLVSVAELRYQASFALLERIVITKDKVSLILPKAENEEFYKTKFSELMQYIMNYHASEVAFKQGKDVMKLEMANRFADPEGAIKYTLNFCKRIRKLVSEKPEEETESAG